MTKPYDATLNLLIDERPEEWVSFLAARVGIPFGPIRVMDTDLSSTLQADKLYNIDGPRPGVLHVELVSKGRLRIPRDAMRYNVITHAATGLPVHTILVLLRPEANASDMTGNWHVEGCDGAEYLRFRYSVLRTWEEPMAAFFAAGAGVAPLAVLTNEAARNMEGAYGAVNDELQSRKLTPEQRGKLMNAAFILGGLRYDREVIEGIEMSMQDILEDSVTIQLWQERGARKLLIRQGTLRFGAPTAENLESLRAIQDLERFQRIGERIFEAKSWDDLLATP